MLFDANLLFSNYQSLAVTAATSGSVASTTVIDLSVSRDLGEANDGIGSVPKIVVMSTQSAITSACGSATLNIQFQGSTDSSNWTTYIETGAMTTTSLTSGSMIANFAWPRRAIGAAVPRYVRLNYSFSGSTTAVISTGIVYAGVVLEAQQNSVGNYSAGFTVS
jgi:hypothetical protein